MTSPAGAAPRPSGRDRTASFIPSPSRLKKIVRMAGPLVLGMASQNVMNLVDTAMVGRFGKHALAAVGLSFFFNMMAMSIVTGFASGVQAMAARRKGEGRRSDLAEPLNAGIVLGIGVGLPVTLLFVGITPQLFALLTDDPAVIAAGVPYLRARLAGLTGLGLLFIFRGYWSAVNRANLYLVTLLIMVIANALLNYALIFGKFGAPALGVEGAGIGTTISNFLGAFVYVVLGLRFARQEGFLRGLPSLETIRTVARLSAPAAVQNLFFGAGMTAYMRIIGMVSTDGVAAANVLVNLMLVVILTSIGFGLAGASLVGQALGRKDPADAKLWGWHTSVTTGAIIAVVALPALIAPDFVLGQFIHDAAVLDVARLPMLLTAIFVPLDAAGLILWNAHLGAGDTRRAMLITVIGQWALALPAQFIAVKFFGASFLTVWLIQLGYRGSQALVFAYFWQRGAWAKIRV